MKVAAKKNKILVVCACIISIATIVLFLFLKIKVGFVSQTNKLLLFFKQCNSVNYFSLQMVVHIFLLA